MTQFHEHETLARSGSLRVRALATIAWFLGVLIHIDGMPYGREPSWHRRQRHRLLFAADSGATAVRS